MRLSFVAPLTPVPKPRPRGQLRYAKAGGKPFVHIYTPDDGTGYEKALRVYAREARGEAPLLAGPVSVRIMFSMMIPKSWPNGKRAAARQGMVYPVGRPDIDNLAKAVLDACNGVFWSDDTQITDLIVTKRYGLEPSISMVAAEIDLVAKAAGREAIDRDPQSPPNRDASAGGKAWQEGAPQGNPPGAAAPTRPGRPAAVAEPAGLGGHRREGGGHADEAAAGTRPGTPPPDAIKISDETKELYRKAYEDPDDDDELPGWLRKTG